MCRYDKAGRRSVAAAYASLPFLARAFIRLRLAILPLEEVESRVPPGSIADIGCGYGIMCHYLAYTDPRRTVTGFERDPVLVSRASETVGPHEPVRFVEDDAESISLKRYDGVVLCDLLHHLSPQGQEHVVRTAIESLGFHGRIIIKDIEKERSIYYYWNLFHDRVMRLSGPTFHRTAEEWAVMVGGSRMRLIEKRHFRHFLYHHIIIVAERV